VYISVNNNTNLIFLKILSNYNIWDRLSQKPSHATVPLKCDVFVSNVPVVFFICTVIAHTASSAGTLQYIPIFLYLYCGGSVFVGT
jgi:hypothetical protein